MEKKSSQNIENLNKIEKNLKSKEDRIIKLSKALKENIKRRKKNNY